MNSKEILKKDDGILNHIRNIKLIQALYQGKKFFVQCYPTDNGAQCFPNTNFAVKEIELPNFELTQEKEGYKWVSKESMTEYRSIGEREAAIGFKKWCDKEGWTWNAGKNLRRGGVKNSIYLSYEQVYEIYAKSLLNQQGEETKK